MPEFCDGITEFHLKFVLKLGYMEDTRKDNTKRSNIKYLYKVGKIFLLSGNWNGRGKGHKVSAQVEFINCKINRCLVVIQNHPYSQKETSNSSE